MDRRDPALNRLNRLPPRAVALLGDSPATRLATLCLWTLILSAGCASEPPPQVIDESDSAPPPDTQTDLGGLEDLGPPGDAAGEDAGQDPVVPPGDTRPDDPTADSALPDAPAELDGTVPPDGSDGDDGGQPEDVSDVAPDDATTDLGSSDVGDPGDAADGDATIDVGLDAPDTALDAPDTVDCEGPPTDEVVNGADDDCDGEIDEDTVAWDNDGDGFCQTAPCAQAWWLGGDCDDTNPAVHPAADEVASNRADDDCDGRVDVIDRDRDGYVSAAAGGDDCDDSDPEAHPGRAEVRDGKDNNCDTLRRIDEGLVQPGDLVITEVMADPATPIGDADGEWFEVYNRTPYPIDLRGWTLLDEGTDRHVVDASVVVPPRRFVTLGILADAARNGGISHAYGYAGYALANGEDEVILCAESVATGPVCSTPIATFTYARAQTGVSEQLDSAALWEAGLPAASSWCRTPTGAFYTYTSGNRGTPGQSNAACSDGPALGWIAREDDDNAAPAGLAAGGTRVVLWGDNFQGGETVRFGGAAATAVTRLDNRRLAATTPPGSAGLVDVVVTGAGGTATARGAWRYWGVDAARAAQAMWPRDATLVRGVRTRATAVFARPASAPATGPVFGVRAQLGYGPASADPRTSAAFVWTSGFWIRRYDANDAYTADLLIPTAGAWRLVWRFSEDAGQTWTYADGDGGPFTPAALPAVTVVAPG